MGFAHLRDARILAERLERDPNSWHSMREVLPLLSQKKYYKTLKYGYARGTEPVRYVQRIRNYQEVLRHQFENTADGGPAPGLPPLAYHKHK